MYVHNHKEAIGHFIHKFYRGFSGKSTDVYNSCGFKKKKKKYVWRECTWLSQGKLVPSEYDYILPGDSQL